LKKIGGPIGKAVADGFPSTVKLDAQLLPDGLKAFRISAPEREECGLAENAG
jgi:hypothetical protein